MSNRFFIFILVVIAGIFGFFAIVKQDKSDSGSTASSNVQPSNHVKGSDKTGVLLVEYADFQCPACGQYYPVLQQVYEKYKDQIQFQFRHFPLSQIHPNAVAAHRAAEAAGKQGKFWEMHDQLYEGQSQWSSATNTTAIFDSYAESLQLDMAKFKTDAASAEVNGIINADRDAGNKLGVNSTPTFILDGVKIENPRSAEDFYKIIDEAIAKKTKS